MTKLEWSTQEEIIDLASWLMKIIDEKSKQDSNIKHWDKYLYEVSSMILLFKYLNKNTNLRIPMTKFCTKCKIPIHKFREFLVGRITQNQKWQLLDTEIFLPIDDDKFLNIISYIKECKTNLFKNDTNLEKNDELTAAIRTLASIATITMRMLLNENDIKLLNLFKIDPNMYFSLRFICFHFNINENDVAETIKSLISKNLILETSPLVYKLSNNVVTIQT